MMQICPRCGSIECEYKDGIVCRKWVCASGKVESNKGEYGGVKAGYKGFEGMMEMLNRVCKGEERK